MSLEMYFDEWGDENPAFRKDWGVGDPSNYGSWSGGTDYIAFKDRTKPWGPKNADLIYHDPTGGYNAPNEAEARRQAILAAEGTPWWDDHNALTNAERQGKVLGRAPRTGANLTATSASKGGVLSLASQGTGVSAVSGSKHVFEPVTKPDTELSTIDDQSDDRLTDVWRPQTVHVYVRGPAPMVLKRSLKTWAWLGFWLAETARLVYPTGHMLIIKEGD